MSRITANLIVRIILLNPCWEHLLSPEVKRCEIQSFVEECFNFFFDKLTVSSTTIRMQCFFFGRYLSREQYKEQKKQIVLKNCSSLIQKLKKSWHNHTEDFNDMHDDLIKLILIKEGLNDADDQTAFLEMKAAVSSIFPVSALSSFVLSNQKTKMAFINEISSIAAGIRLHSWYSNRAGKFMLDVGKIMKEILPKTCEDVHEEFNAVKKEIEDLQGSLQEKVEAQVSSNNEEFHFQKILLINKTNYYRFLKILKENIDEMAVQTYKLDYAFTVQIKELNSALNSGPFALADQVYPCYKKLSKTWRNVQLEGSLLEFYINLFQELKEFNECVKSIQNDRTDENIINDNVPENYNSDEEKTITIFPEDVKNFADISLEFEEFCAYYASTGILIPARRSFGIIMYKELCYCFSTEKALDCFRERPEHYVQSSLKEMHSYPELILTFGWEKYFQFPVLVNLLNKKTHSTQTNLSHFRRENHSQVYLPKDNWMQTKKDSGTTMERTGIPELGIRIKKSFT
ncbi:cilia- and flagella-associated protein 206-like isoform X2 [Uloborus diversus]|uniref:cilia- and flagella-associated protein 206-like isoform X2 n=1 Tax=Uloborus diversus TaxID=327109 RepID=UPI00240A115D|nr:cilia- and flagella-associated protein 206-like isoform X2 [Uloborus diversus]